MLDRVDLLELRALDDDLGIGRARQARIVECLLDELRLLQEPRRIGAEPGEFALVTLAGSTAFDFFGSTVSVPEKGLLRVG